MHPAVSVEGGEARPAAHLQPELGCVVRWILLGPPPRTHVDASRARASPLSLSLFCVTPCGRWPCFVRWFWSDDVFARRLRCGWVLTYPATRAEPAAVPHARRLMAAAPLSGPDMSAGMWRETVVCVVSI